MLIINQEDADTNKGEILYMIRLYSLAFLSSTRAIDFIDTFFLLIMLEIFRLVWIGMFLAFVISLIKT